MHLSLLVPRNRSEVPQIRSVIATIRFVVPAISLAVSLSRLAELLMNCERRVIKVRLLPVRFGVPEFSFAVLGN